MDVNKGAIELAYKLFLDRTPSEQEVENMATNQTTLAGLRRVFLNSAEFNTKFSNFRANAERKAVARTLIHLHLPKTAGSSLTKILAPNHARGTQLTVGDASIDTLKKQPPQQRRAISFLFGHMSHGVARHLPQKHTYICVLRRPGPRLLSYYNYLYRTKDHPSHPTVKGQEMTFGTFLEWSSDPQNAHRGEVDNGQIRRLAGYGMRKRYGEEAALLPIALSNLLAPDMVYGLTEYFDDFVKRLHTRGLIKEKVDIRENAAPNPASLDEALTKLSPGQKELYDCFIRWDQKLYNISEQLYFAGTSAKQDTA